MDIGRVYGGPELTGSSVDHAISRVIVLKHEYQTSELPALDIELHVPGSIWMPEHSGVRTGTLSRRQQRLRLQIAVPADLLEAEDEAVYAFLLSALREGVHLATERFRRARIPYDEQKHLTILDKIAARLIH
jgi:hypothetical protein